MATKRENGNQSAKIIMSIFAFFVFLLIFNVMYLGVTGKHLISGNDIKDYAERRGGNQRVDTLYARRGTIYSSDHEVISSDVRKYKLYAILAKRYYTNKEPAYVVDKEKTAEKLAPILGVDKAKILKRLQTNSYQVEFGNYGNNLSSLVKDQIDALGLPGLEFDELISRNYRYGDFASYTVGYAQMLTQTIKGKTTKSIVGQMGIEKNFEKELSGTDGQKIYLADNNGFLLPNGIISETQPVAGHDVYLTIDTDVQNELEIQMKRMVESQQADKATAAIMDVKTGRILAIVDYPSFNPNDRNLKNYVQLFFNEPVECGSVFKSFVYGHALTNNHLNVKSTYPSGHYYYKVNGKTVADIKDHNGGKGWGTISYESGFYHSSNTAICQMLTKIVDKEGLLQDYEDLGFFQKHKVDGIETAAGIAGYKRKGERTLEYLTTGFGQGSTVTAYDLLRGYSLFGNDGKIVEPYLVEKVVDSEKNETIYQAKTKYTKQIFSTEAVKTMRDLLSGVVNGKGNTGYTFRMEDMNLIGKTGTGQVAKDGKYMKNYYTRSFCGLAPYEDPQVAIVFWYQGYVGGNRVPAQLVSSVIKAALNKLNEQPTQEVETSTFILDPYTNQSVQFAKNMLGNHQLVPLFVGDGDTIIDQYPKAKSEVSSRSRIFLQTNGTKVTMPSMEGWSRKEAEAFASMANVVIKFEGIGLISEQDIPKGTVLDINQEITVRAN